MVTEPNIDEKFRQFTIDNGVLCVNLLEYGATIANIFFKGHDCVAGYDNPIDFTTGTSFQGATVGRYANRIGGKFTLDSKEYALDINDRGCNCLHGGKTSFAKQILKGEAVADNAVRFTHFSKDGESGFPANVEFSVTFTVCGSKLSIEYDAVADAKTYLNFTNHAYFTLGAKSNKTTLLQICAEYMTPVDENLIPTGELRKVEGTGFDFREPKPIGKDLEADDKLIAAAKGFDHNFVLGLTKEYRKNVATAYSPETDITVRCSTDMPGLQLYSGNGLNEPKGKNGGLVPYCAFCLETQFFPDTPNQPDFPSALVNAGEHFTSITEYEFE